MGTSSGPIINALRKTRRLVNQSLGRDVRASIQHQCNKEILGSNYGCWCICPDAISASSVVYSFGVGQDISFDLAIINRFGLHVQAFDPTPKSIHWVKQQNLPPEFHFHELGLAEYDGEATFVLPRADYVSFAVSSGDEKPDGERVVKAQVRRLQTIAGMLGHGAINILKMDIEGAELNVIEDLAKTKVRIDQLLVEFHHTIGNASEVAQVTKAIATLNRLGFKLFYNSVVGREFSFIRE